ncbi:GMP synthase [glutamine-hydrolyzing] [Fusarium keratoplasticum]|uniref:GMP synthase [glutamine-hydrolyzing] n=1 Tax=Fusarium keratoplasticum TaxID=1328300 RepID=A0ACC0QD63_9HYPO|nr:GMP synthase [glutamine-hydrolyzing] [Fusarium keratoplasticum]KAI8650290.1 GMP synthase [glutamine-hydrolyzing] [Fusarium keratoplasticum]KAI8651128.1 GMP synthase [glutamine-hydrolyzing] [Fusarium keratoplasticum]
MATGIDAEAPHNNFDTILVLDFGSQTSHLILRRLRALSVYAEMLPCTTKLADLTWKPKGIVLSGGPSSVYDEGSPHVDPAVFELGVPILGICYGCQEIAWQTDSANVARGIAREYGHADVTIHKVDNHVDRLFAGLGETMHAYMSHFDKLVRLPEGFVVVAKTANSEFAGIAHQSKPIFGVQFHPELEHTPRGSELLRNFSVDICGAQPNWVMSDFIEQEIARIRKLVGDKAQVIGAVSGGVDSTVAAKLMKEAIGDRFHAVLIDNGLMRLNECEQVKETLQQHLGINLTVVDGAELFLGRLKGVREPEKKRKIIGETFIDLFEKEAIRIEKEAENTPNAGKVSWFLQGTLYPDVIESLSFKGPSATIKTHHNVGGLPKRMMDGQGLRLLEPLRELFKDEVRALGRRLQIHEDLVNRHPFPGPGIGVRVLGDITPERVEIARKADHIFISMIKEAGIYNEMSQAYAGLDTNKAVGVMGDTRVYGYIVILRAVTTSDFMSAEPYEFSFKLLKAMARRIVNEVDGVSRVTYDLSSKPPGTIELE